MTMGDRMRLKSVSWVLMLAVAASLAARASAEEAGSQPSSDAKATNSEPHPHDSSATDKNAAPASSGANTDDIDTRITVQPHPPPGKLGKGGNAANPIQPLKLVNAHRRTFSPSRAGNRIAPNALGVLNGERQIPQGLGEHFEFNGARPTPGIATAARAGAANVGLARPGSNLGREPAFPSTGIPPLGAKAKTVSRGSIGGPGSTHYSVGASASGIGGPARPVTGINGTSIRATR